MIENGLDGGPVAPVRALPPRRAAQPLRLLRPAHPFKGIKVLVEAVTRIPERAWGDAILYVFGGNLEHQPPEFQAQVKDLFRLAGRRLRFMGSYASADLPHLMREVDWTIVPSTWWENAPVVIQEAFHHGRPVIASGIGGMAEKVRDGVDGLHFRVSNPESLAEAMTRAMAEPGLWDRLHAGIGPPQSPARAAALHADLFETLLARRAGAQSQRRAAHG
jgi:glycosyltransferase involved in cell wall biosynthesis